MSLPPTQGRAVERSTGSVCLPLFFFDDDDSPSRESARSSRDTHVLVPNKCCGWISKEQILPRWTIFANDVLSSCSFADKYYGGGDETQEMHPTEAINH